MSVMTDIVEALLFASGNPISEKDLVDKVQGLTRNTLVAVKKDLAKKYPKDGSGVVFLEFNGKLQFSTNPKYGDAIAEILTPLKEKELTKTLLEVLSTIAYKQPITKLELEDMRGGTSLPSAIEPQSGAGGRIRLPALSAEADRTRQTGSHHPARCGSTQLPHESPRHHVRTRQMVGLQRHTRHADVPSGLSAPFRKNPR